MGDTEGGEVFAGGADTGCGTDIGYGYDVGLIIATEGSMAIQGSIPRSRC